jgi:hypothetical protein
MGFWDSVLEKGAPLILAGVEKLADHYVKGENLNVDQKRILWNGYNLLSTFGTDIVNSTENTYDNAAVSKLLDFCIDTAGEAGLELPTIPDEILAVN